MEKKRGTEWDSGNMAPEEVEALWDESEANQSAFAEFSKIMSKPLLTTEHWDLSPTEVFALTCQSSDALEKYIARAGVDGTFPRTLYAIAEACRSGDTPDDEMSQLVAKEVIPRLEKEFGAGGSEKKAQEVLERAIGKNEPLPDAREKQSVENEFEARLLGAFASMPEKEVVKEVGKKLAQLMLPFWSDEVRAEANVLIRSALFAATKTSAERQMVKNKEIAALDGIKICYTGQELNQYDAEVFEEVLHVAREQSLGTECVTTAYALLKALGVDDCGDSRDALWASIRRMVECSIDARKGKGRMVGHLFDLAEKDDATGHYRIRVSPDIARIFAKDVTYLPRKLLSAIRTSPNASWLCRFFLSHQNPLSYGYETLRVLSGSTDKNPRKAKYATKRALQKIADKHAALAATDPDYAEETGKNEWIIADDGTNVAVAHHRSTPRHRDQVAAINQAKNTGGDPAA